MYKALLAGAEMLKSKVPVIAVLLMLNASVYAQEKKSSVLLPESAAHHVSRLCSREGLPRVDGSWRPTTHDIELLESRLVDVSQLQGEGEPKNIQIGQPSRYYRQYVAVVVGGHKLIYVNAFSSVKPPPSWRTQLVDICDGGSADWGVLYDPPTGHFSELRTNAVLPLPPPRLQLAVDNRWDEKAGLRRDAIRSQVIDALEAQEIKETGNEKG
jgi:hypothetical protein